MFLQSIGRDFGKVECRGSDYFRFERTPDCCGVGKVGANQSKAGGDLPLRRCVVSFLHPAVASQGDLGIVQFGDILLTLS